MGNPDRGRLFSDSKAHRRTFGGIAALVTLLSVLPNDAAGQAQPARSAPQALSYETQAALANGVAAAQQRDYLRAIDFFQYARNLAPAAPVVFLDLGLAESNLPGRELRAVCWFQAYLASAPNAANAPAVRDAIQNLDAKSRSNLAGMVKVLVDAASQVDPATKAHVEKVLAVAADSHPAADVRAADWLFALDRWLDRNIFLDPADELRERVATSTGEDITELVNEVQLYGLAQDCVDNAPTCIGGQGRAQAAGPSADSYVRIVPDGQTRIVDGDDGPLPTILGFVGMPFNAHISYQIGWDTFGPDGGAPLTHASAITDPQFDFTCTNCANDAQITLSPQGILSGTPTAPFKKSVYPAVRDKTPGNTKTAIGIAGLLEYTEDTNKLMWTQSKDGTVVLVVRKPDLRKQLHFRCALRPSRFGDVRLNLDPDIGYVEVLGSAGEISGFYHVDPASGRLRWPRLGLGTLGYRVNGVTFDRASGMMSVALRSAPDGLAQLTGTCIAGSTTADGDGRADLPKSSALDSNARADLN